MTQIWSVYNRESRLILGLSDEPGIFNFARPPSDEVEPLECEFATFQCYDATVEAELLCLLDATSDLDDFFQGLLDAGYKIVEGQPQPGRFARL